MTTDPTQPNSPDPLDAAVAGGSRSPARTLPAILAALLAAAVFAPAATLAGSAEEGQEIAARWCSSCHNIGSGNRPTASDTIPTFHSIAQRDNFNRVQLEAWIGNPHPPMPDFNLSRDEIDSLVSYIESLRKPR